MSQKIPIKKFSFRILVFSVVVAALTVLFQWLCPTYASPALPFIVLFFLIITLFSLYIVLRDSSGKAGKQFVSNYVSCPLRITVCWAKVRFIIQNNPKIVRKFLIAFLFSELLKKVHEKS